MGLLIWVETSPMPRWSVCTLHSCQAAGSCCLVHVCAASHVLEGVFSPFILLWIELTSKRFCSSYLQVKPLEKMMRAGLIRAMSVGQRSARRLVLFPGQRELVAVPLGVVSAGRVIMGKPAKAGLQCPQGLQCPSKLEEPEG